MMSGARAVWELFTLGNSFLRGDGIIATNDIKSGVNPLHLGELISTYKQLRKGLLSRVSIPFTPGNSFLHKIKQGDRDKGEVCQSPSHRGTHFYDNLNRLLWKLRAVSIPFTPGNSFLLTSSFCYGAALVCVNPLHLGELISTLYLIFCWFYTGFQPRFPGYFPDNSEKGCFFGHFNIFKYFL